MIRRNRDLAASEVACMVNADPTFRRLLRNTLIALLVCVALVAVCYFFVDRPFAYFVHDSDRGWETVLKALTDPPPFLERWAPAVLAALMVRRAWGRPRRCELTVLAACLGLLLAEEFRQALASVFGRTWPETWIDNNPSLIRDGVSGFNFFHGGAGYRSFPSGHTARTLAACTPLWIAYPRWRWFCVLASVAVAVGLLGMNYHFVSDVIAGGFVGAVLGAYTAHCCGLGRKDGEGQ
jgi:membrane-associated phospholipid phosphatase